MLSQNTKAELGHFHRCVGGSGWLKTERQNLVWGEKDWFSSVISPLVISSHLMNNRYSLRKDGEERWKSDGAVDVPIYCRGVGPHGLKGHF